MVRNVGDGVPLPSVVRKKKRFLTHEQVASWRRPAPHARR